MKTFYTRLLILGVATLVVMTPDALAQRQLGKKKGPTSKLYVAEASGTTQIKNGDKLYTASQASAFDAPGTVIETSGDSQATFVYSNGVGMTIGENSRVEINRFDQAPFTANSASNGVDEPSSSQSEVYVSRGSVGLSTSKLATGSTMSVATPLASVNVRGGNISIETTDDVTTISMLDGSATVFTGGKDGMGTVLNAGEKIVIRRPPIGKLPIIQLSPIAQQDLVRLTDFIGTANNARKTVSFAVIEQKATQGLDVPAGVVSSGASSPGGEETAELSAGAAEEDSGPTQEIVAKPTVPATLPTNIVVSPDRLTGG